MSRRQFRRMVNFVHSIRGRMLLLVAAAVLPAVLLAVFVAQQADREQARAAREEALRLSLLVAQKQEEVQAGARRLLEILSTLPAISGDDREACRRLLGTLIEEGSIYLDFMVVDPEGRLLCSARDAVADTDRVAEAAWFEKVKATRTFVVGEYDRIGPEPRAVLPVALPLLDEEGRARRVLVATLALEVLRRFLGEIVLPDGAGISLIDRDGAVLVHVPDDQPRPGDSFPVPALVERALESRVEVVPLPAADGQARVFGVALLADSGIRAIVRMEPGSAIASLLGAEMWPLLWLALAQVFILLAIFVAARRDLLRPIEALAEAAARLSEGELSARSGLAPYRRDELGRLALVFDRMADSQQHRQEALEVRGARAEARLRAALWASDTGTFHWDLRSNLLEYDPNLARLFGLAANERAESLEEFVARIHPEDRPRVLEAMERCASQGADFDSEFRVVWPDGTVRWLDDKGKTFSDGHGRPVSLTGACSDITARKRFEEQQRLLMGELNHRVKNMLATVQSIMLQTLQRSGSLEAFGDAFAGRLAALAHAHDLLTQGKWEAAEMRDLVEQALSPYGAAMVVEGPPVAVRPKAALTISLILHELATNAARHGALTAPTGRVEIGWRPVRTDDGQALELVWHESGGPPAVPPTRRGFGLNLIERSIAYDLDGEADVAFPPEGLRCRITLPWAGNVLEAGRREPNRAVA